MDPQRLISLCQRHNALLLGSDDNILSIAVVGAAPAALTEALHFASQKRVDIESWTQERMDKHLQTAPQTSLPAASQASGSAVEMLNITLQQALIRRASDIHFEPASEGYRARVRVDGVLHALATITPNIAASLIARLKVLGGLDIAERRLPQDGQFCVDLSGKAVSFRIASLPCLGGEKVVLRLLHQVSQALDIQTLGMSAKQLAAFSSALQQPQGLVLVSGPTGSGKTVTLYSALQQRNTPEVNICSVEDPVEIPIDGLNQTQINPRAGLSFQAVLRALLRQDPDVVMVGEIRDSETAEIAIKAAQTGHLVLSTIHTNSTCETLVRLQQMGVARWMLSSALTLVVAQRLVRKLCPWCRVKNPDNTPLPEGVWPRPLPRWRAPGCERCYHGFYGRAALFEVLPVNTGIRHAIADDLSVEQLERQARQAGMATLFESGCLAVEQGMTTLEELIRVLGIPDAS